MPADDVGHFLDLAPAARRPLPLVELRAYGIVRKLRGASVIDIGTGDGRLAIGAVQAGASEVVGIDPDPAAVRAARTRARELGLTHIRFEEGAAQDLSVHRARFDVAILSWSL